MGEEDITPGTVDTASLIEYHRWGILIPLAKNLKKMNLNFF
jgi:hypothetical protein